MQAENQNITLKHHRRKVRERNTLNIFFIIMNGLFGSDGSSEGYGSRNCPLGLNPTRAGI